MKVHHHLGCLKNCLQIFQTFVRRLALDLRKERVGPFETTATVYALCFLKCFPIFRELVKTYPLAPSNMDDIQLYLKWQPSTFAEILKCLKNQGNINEFNLPFLFYSTKQPFSLLEMLFEASEEYGIDMNVPNEHVMTLLEIANINEEHDIIKLYEKFTK